MNGQHHLTGSPADILVSIIIGALFLAIVIYFGQIRGE